ncbi:MAG TPA: response regulator transcription factor [Usitatibacter sp.]|nr:response regulator transcription factor [Usitatibacter sp.]
MNPIRVLIADDHQLVAAGLRLMVEKIPGTLVVGEVFNGREALAAAVSVRPDVVLMDISMRDLNGIEATRHIVAEAPGVRVVILSSHESEDFVHRSVRAGAVGYLVKGAASQELASALNAVVRGEMYFSPSVVRHLTAGLAGGAQIRSSALEALTARQREILQLIAEGNSTKEIAHLLGLSVKTVETHRAVIMDRLDIRDVPGLVVFAIRNGLIEIDPDKDG